MPAVIALLLWLAAIVLLAYVCFWVIAKMGLPEPAALIARVVVGLVALYLIAAVFVPALGVKVPGL